MSSRRSSATLAVLGVCAALVGLVAAPAGAAPGDAAARGLVLDLGAEVNGVAVLSGSVSAGSAAAPPGGAERLAGVEASGIGVAGGAAVVDVSATSDTAGSGARSLVSGLDLTIFGQNALTAEAVEATASCPTFGTGNGETRVAASGLRVLGQAVSLEAGTPRVVSTGVDLGVDGLAGATLEATVTRTELDAPTAARATAVEVAFRLTVTPLLQAPETVDVGSATLARVSCERPALPPPSVTSLTPGAGPQDGGTTVTITGAHFVPGGTTVAFGGLTPAAATVDASGTSLTVVTPASPAPGPVDVTIGTAAGTTALPGAYTYLPDQAGGAPAGMAPVVTGLEPGGGPTAGGTSVTITGSGLRDTTGVTFGGVSAPGVVVAPDGSRVTATTPPSETAGPVPVVLEGPSPVGAGSFTYAAPTIADIEPDRGPLAGGTRVVLTGSGLAGATAVTFDGRAGTDLVVSPDGTGVSVTTPAGRLPRAVDVAVQLRGADATVPNGYTYLDDGTRPALNGLEPDSGPAAGGTTVTLTGAGLAGASEVTFGGVPGTNPTANPEGTRLTVTTPSGPVGAAPVAVRFVDGSEVSSARPFTYQATAAAADEGAQPRRSGGNLLARTGLPLLAVALVGAGLTTAGHLIRRPH